MSRRVIFEDFDLSSHKALLQTGSNVLAVHGLNDDRNSSDFLILPELRATVFEDANRIPITRTTTVKARAFDGNEWSALHEARFIVGQQASSENVLLTEIHYHPAAPSEDELQLGYTRRSLFEFVELSNPGSVDAILDGTAFTDGIRATLEGIIPAGASVLIVSDEAAFLHRYGTSLKSKIIATFQQGTNLSDSGEKLVLADRDGGSISEVTYDDSAPWPVEADGSGPSLISDGEDWTASSEPGGSPGTFESDSSSSSALAEIQSVSLIANEDGSPAALRVHFVADSPTSEPVVEFSGDFEDWIRLESTSGETGVVDAVLPPAAIEGFVRLRFE